MLSEGGERGRDIEQDSHLPETRRLSGVTVYTFGLFLRGTC